MPSVWITWVLGLPVVMPALSLLWLRSVQIENVAIIDTFWGPGFSLLSAAYILVNGFPHPLNSRGLLLLGLAAVWGGRLGIHLYFRNRNLPEDHRYAAMRRNAGPKWWWFSFFQVFALQGVLMWLISLPLAVGVKSSRSFPNALDIIGVIVALFGVGWEATADWQLSSFKKNPANKGKTMRYGLWRYSRHPNYFGDSVVWWGLYIASGLNGTPWWLSIPSAITGPVLMTALLMKVSGVPLTEERMKATRPDFAEYVAVTSSFVPCPPGLCKPLLQENVVDQKDSSKN